MTPEQSPLGKPVHYTEQYDASLLFPIDRKRARDSIGVPARLPFFGTDIWNAYELSWLNRRGKPQTFEFSFSTALGWRVGYKTDLTAVLVDWR